MTLKETLLKNGAWLLVGEISDKILSYILIVILARMLGDVGLGEYSFVFAAAQTAFLLADVGVGDYMIREISRKPERTQELFLNAAFLKIGLNLAGFLAAIVFALTINKSMYIVISMIVLSIRLVLENWGSLFEVVFQSKNQMQFVTGGQIVERLMALTLGAYVLLSDKGLMIFFIVLLVAYSFKFMYQLFFFIKKWPSFKIVELNFSLNFKTMRELISGGVPLWLTRIFASIYFRIDVVMLSLLVGDQVVGWYSAAYKLIDALNFFPYVIFVSIFPSMSRLFVEDKNMLLILINRVVRYLTYLALPIAIGTILLSERILQFIYGNQFSNSVFVLKILIIAEALVFITFILSKALNSIGREKNVTHILVFLSIFNIVLNFILIPKYLHIGAAISTVISEILSLAILSFIIKKYLSGIKYSMLKPLIASLFMGLIIYLISSFAIWWLIIIGVLSYVFALYLLKIPEEDKLLIREITEKSKRLFINCFLQ